MYMTGNKATVHQLLRGCREAFRSAKNDGFGELLKIYEILFDMCRPARIVDEECLRILGEHLIRDSKKALTIYKVNQRRLVIFPS